jgi:ribosomal protein S18 acetylase RimI-like enzyme
MQVLIEKNDIVSSEAQELINELSGELLNITGNSGRGSFDEEDMKNPRSVFVIAKDEGIAVGCGAFRELSHDVAEIKRMYSRKKSCGVGSAILAYLEEAAKELGYSSIVLETRRCNEKAVAFYLHQGYIIISNYGKYINISEAICFEKRLR